MAVTVRKAEISDAETLCRLIHSLAQFEDMADECTATPESVAKMMTEENGLGGVIAEENGKAVGMAVYSLYKLATFSGKRILYIEDIYVDEAVRNSGIGSMIFEKLKELAEEYNCRRLEWKCLAWNSNARQFYEKHGGRSDPEWLTYTLEK